MSWVSRLVNAFRPERTAAGLDEELRFHLEQRIEDLVGDGMPRRDAERAARLKFGGALQIREATQEVKSAAWLESVAADFRFGFRMLRKSRNASMAAIGSLGLAIGACSAAFALLDALVFRPLPLPHPEPAGEHRPASCLGFTESGRGGSRIRRLHLRALRAAAQHRPRFRRPVRDGPLRRLPAGAVRRRGRRDRECSGGDISGHGFADPRRQVPRSGG